MLLASCNVCNVRMCLRQYISHIEKVATFQTLKNKIDELTYVIEFGEFLSLSLESLSLVTSMHYVCYLFEENKSSMNELRYN